MREADEILDDAVHIECAFDSFEIFPSYNERGWPPRAVHTPRDRRHRLRNRISRYGNGGHLPNRDD